MSIEPQENRSETSHGPSGTGESRGRRKRRRGGGRKPAAAPQGPAAGAADHLDLEDDDEDDLELPTYGKRIDAGAKTSSAAAPRKPSAPTVKQPQKAPAAHRPQPQRTAHERPPAKPAAKPAEKPTARPQAARLPSRPPAKPQAIHAKPPAPPKSDAVRPAPAKPRTEHKKPSAERPPRDARRQSSRDPHQESIAEPSHAADVRPAPRVHAAHSPEFAALGLSPVMLDALAAAAYQEPTPVQSGVIPRALAGVDVMGQAQTGTGKTAAFAIPILELLQPHHRGAPPQALVLVPTRELAVQVRDECEKLALGRRHAIVAVYGGKPLRKQIEQVAAGASVIVGTPGRVLDLMSRGALTWGGLRVVVLDEADRMLDIGFRPDIEKILRRCPQARQTLLLSATLAPPVKRLAERYMREPEVLDFSPKNLAVETIEQFYFTVDPERKFDLLVKLLERENPKQAIIFCRTKRGTDKICTRLSRRFQDVDTIHGDLQQSARDRVMKGFREGRVHWLVATDVVGRGIDVSGISHIINFDIPAFCDDYVHRVGRTGRMGREGVAYTFVTPEEGGELTRIEIRINRLLHRDEIPGFQAFDDPRAAESVVLGDGPGGMDDDLVEAPKPVPVFGKRAPRRVRRAL